MDDLLTKISDFLYRRELIEGEGVDLFIDNIPSTPDQVVCIVEYPGGGPLPGGGAARNFQVSARSSRDNPSWARIKAWQLYNRLCPPELIIDDRYDEYEGYHEDYLWGVFRARQTPIRLYTDDNGRPTYGFNMIVVGQTD